MSDIVARMRCRTLMWNCGNGDVRDVPDEDCLEAADEIERLCEALKLILNANSLPYAQEIAAKALEEEK
jgi:hypothetical protein